MAAADARTVIALNHRVEHWQAAQRAGFAVILDREAD
jgi:hypothetical protein